MAFIANRVIGVLLTGLAATVLSSCGGSQAVVNSGGATVSTTSATTTTVQTGTSTSAGTDAISGPITFDGGLLRFDPPSAAYVPTISAAQAYTAAQTGDMSGFFAEALHYFTPTVKLGMYTNYETGSAIADTSQVQLSFVNVPVWIITFTGVPVTASGGGSPPGSVVSSVPTITEDLVMLINSETGKRVSGVLEDLPDHPAYPPRTCPSAGVGPCS